jgi:hypothetical protein
VQPLIIAVGGGGDAITAAALAIPLHMTRPPVVMTYSWDRLLIDPVPGPRSASNFTGLDDVAPGVHRITPTTTPRPPAGSSLPRLAAELPAQLLLLDPTHGTVGLADQITAAARHVDADHLVLVDVGGDALTTGTDEGLRSPLADQLSLAACIRTGLPSRLVIAGAGLDGELPAETVAQRLADLGAESLPDLDAAAVKPVRHVFRWHPSEASGLLAAAAAGHHGVVEVRDAGDRVHLSAATTRLAWVDAKRASSITPAAHLTDCDSFAAAQRTIRDLTGISEIDYETRKAGRRAQTTVRQPTTADLPAIDEHAATAAAHDSDYLSIRRLAELLGATTLDAFAALIDVVEHYRTDRYTPSLYRTRPAR